MDVGLNRSIRVLEACIHIRLRGKMDDSIDLLLSYTLPEVFRGSDIPSIEGEVGAIIQHLGVFQGRAVIELVEGDDVVVV